MRVFLTKTCFRKEIVSYPNVLICNDKNSEARKKYIFSSDILIRITILLNFCTISNTNYKPIRRCRTAFN